MYQIYNNVLILYIYMSIIYLHADTLQAMEMVVSKLYKEYGIGTTPLQYIVLVGDQKTLSRVHELKQMYGSELDWLIPFIGDWHLLSNYQSVFMKVYYDVGLKELTESAGHRGETLTSISKCSSFKITHAFLTQAWEAIYRYIFKLFDHTKGHEVSLSDKMSATTASILECIRYIGECDSDGPLRQYLNQIEPHYSDLYKCFQCWVAGLAENDANWKFWSNFVFRDLLSYCCLYLSMRGGLWKLRLGGIKNLAPLFAAFDRPHYQKLIPRHLCDIF